MIFLFLSKSKMSKSKMSKSKISKKKQTITINNEVFTRKYVTNQYYDLYITMRMADGFFNVTDICKQLDVNWEEIKKNEVGEHPSKIMYELNEGYPKEVQGIYVNPKLANYVAITHFPKKLAIEKIFGLRKQQS